MSAVMFPPSILRLQPHNIPIESVAPVRPAAPVDKGFGAGVILTLDNRNAPADNTYTDKGVTVGDSRRIQMDKARAAKDSAPCQTCAERTYQDGSSDMGVSFQSPTKVAPESAAGLVRAHEQEHVSREGSKAREKGLNAVSSVRIHTSICPECKKIYVSGGTTTTQYTVNPSQVVDAYAKQMGKTASMLIGA